jgi:hypothetical protein
MSLSTEPEAPSECDASFVSADGLHLSGTFVPGGSAASSVTVLVHGGGATRDETGFFTRLAHGLTRAGMASLRFDLRGHGRSEGRQEDLTLAGVVNDIRAAVAYARVTAGGVPINVVGTSFGGGISGFYTARYPAEVRRLVLFNPLIEYRRRFVDDKPYWHDGRIDEAAGRELTERGSLVHSPTFRLGRALLNEVFYLRPDEAMAQIVTPTLFVHGTKDTFVPIESSRRYVGRIQAEARLVEIDGAQHGFAVHNDPQYQHPQTGEWQAEVIRTVADWLA